MAHDSFMTSFCSPRYGRVQVRSPPHARVDPKRIQHRPCMLSGGIEPPCLIAISVTFKLGGGRHAWLRRPYLICLLNYKWATDKRTSSLYVEKLGLIIIDYVRDLFPFAGKDGEKAERTGSVEAEATPRLANPMQKICSLHLMPSGGIEPPSPQSNWTGIMNLVGAATMAHDGFILWH